MGSGKSWYGLRRIFSEIYFTVLKLNLNRKEFAPVQRQEFELGVETKVCINSPFTSMPVCHDPSLICGANGGFVFVRPGALKKKVGAGKAWRG